MTQKKGKRTEEAKVVAGGPIEEPIAVLEKIAEVKAIVVGTPEGTKVQTEIEKITEDITDEGEEEDFDGMGDMLEESKEYISSTAGKKLLTEPENYLKHGAHIGLTYRTGNMHKFIYKVRQDRLSIFSLNMIDERIRLAAKMLARYDKDDVLVIGSRAYAKRPVRKFAEATGVKYVSGRFSPGSFTNPRESDFREPKIILVADPIADRQAVREAAKVGLALIGVCDSNALTRNTDLIIPMNNKGKQSIALLFWLLTKQYLVERGEMKEGDELKETLEDYVSQIQPTKRIEALIKTKKKERFRS